LGLALDPFPQAVSEVEHLRAEGLRAGPLGVGVALGRDELPTDRGRAAARVETLGVEGGGGLALGVNAVTDVIEQAGEVGFGGLRPRPETLSMQRMPLSSSGMPLRMVPRFQPRSRSAWRWPSRPSMRTVRARNGRRSTPRSDATVCRRYCLIGSVRSRKMLLAQPRRASYGMIIW
jgi:hypothetical protein